MHYPVVIHKDKGSDYGVTVPDLPGCFSAGRTADEALEMAREAIELHLEGLIEEGQMIPPARRIEEHKGKREYAGGTWAVVSVDSATLRINAKRLCITMPERVLDAIDRYVKEHGETRSGLLARAAWLYIGRGGDRTMPRAKTGRPGRGRTKGK